MIGRHSCSSRIITSRFLPRYLKERNPNLIVAQFWHIPWPNRETFRVFPWKEELLDGLLGNDLLGFHLRYHCQNFMETVDRTHRGPNRSRAGRDRSPQQVDAGATVPDQHRFRASGGAGRQHRGRAGDDADAAADQPPRARSWASASNGSITRRASRNGCEALDRFFERYPEYRERLTFVQVGVPSRGHIPSYQPIDKEIDRLVERDQLEMEHARWRPLIYFKRHFSTVEMTALHRLADFCIVSSLHDGMNLVAKEFVASRFDEDGVLLLSQFAGSALELTDALLFNPYAIDELAEAIHQAVEMPPAERKKRMQRMRSAVQDNNVYRWAGKILSALLKFDMPDAPSPEQPGSRSRRNRQPDRNSRADRTTGYELTLRQSEPVEAVRAQGDRVGVLADRGESGRCRTSRPGCMP